MTVYDEKIMDMKNIGIIAGVIGIVAIAGYGVYRMASGGSDGMDKAEADQSLANAVGANDFHRVILKTNYGDIEFQLYDSDAPKTVAIFLKLAGEGFYDGLTFHRVVKGFMIQGGDPSGNGTGGPGYTFADELNSETESYKQGYKKGVVAMANAGPNTNGSQFFILLEDYPLPHNYTIFGGVTNGQGVVDAIGNVAVGSQDRPLSPVVIERVEMIEK